MAEDPEHVTLHEFLQNSADGLEKAQQSTEGLIIDDHGNTYRITFEGKSATGTTRAAQDPFLALGGAFESAEPSDIANHKHEYLADAAEIGAPNN